MSTTPKTPKLLPWLAKKAGITEARAIRLWRDSERWAAHRATRGSSAYYKLAVDHLLQVTAAEALREDQASFGLRPWARAQSRVWAVSMQVMHEGSALSARAWRLLGSAASRARVA